MDLTNISIARNHSYSLNNGHLRAFTDIVIDDYIRIDGGKILTSQYGNGYRYVFPQVKTRQVNPDGSPRYRSQFRILNADKYREFCNKVAEKWAKTYGPAMNSVDANTKAQNQDEDETEKELTSTLNQS